MNQESPLSSISFFISSTYVDMMQHRDSVIRKLQSKSGIINAQEFFGSRNSQPLETCLEEVEQSQVFLLFIGPRYGSTDHESGKSFVEREYEKATELRIPKFAYIIDDEYEYPIKYVSTGKEAESLAAFKARVRDELTVSTFTTPDDLASKVYEDLKRELPKHNFSIGAEDKEVMACRVVDTLTRFCLLPKIYSGRRVHLKCVLGEPKRASESHCNALSLKRGLALACDMYAEDNAISELLLDSRILLFAEGRTAECMLNIQRNESVIVEAETIYGVVEIRTPHYGFEYETGAFDSVLSKLAGKQRVIIGYEETKEELLGLCLKAVSLP
jgi:hypothetical protein